MAIVRYAVASVVLLAAAGLLVSGCGGSAPAATSSPTPASTEPTDPADRLAGLVAVGQDRGYEATYSYQVYGRPTRSVTVTLATDGSWRVDVPGAGLGGGADIAVAGTSKGVYQCTLGDGGSCTRVAKAGGRVPDRYDPKIEKLFVRWLPRLEDRDAALSVATTSRLHGATGTCFSVEPTAASLSSPVPAGVYCLDDNGAVTGARTSLGTLVGTGSPAPAPATVTLPGPAAGGSAVPTASPSPSPSPSASGSSGSAPPPR